MLLNIISLFTFFSLIVFGLVLPRKMGWLMVFLTPLLAPLGVILVPSNFFPINMVRMAAAVTIGVVIRFGLNKSKPLYSSRFIKYLIFFSIILFVVSFNDRLMPFISNYLTGLIFSVFLCYYIVENEKDLKRLIYIFLAHALIMSIYTIIEFLFKDLPNISQWVHDYYGIYEDKFEVVYSIRNLFRRVNGWCGNSVHSSYILITILPLALWLSMKRKMSGLILFGIIIIGLTLLQSRTTIICYLIVVIYFINNLLIKRKIITTNKTFWNLIKIILLLFIVSIFIPGFGALFQRLFAYSLRGLTMGISDVSIVDKIDRIPRAFDYFLSNPLLGYGSPKYVYSVLMNTDDIPSIFIYLLSGGLFMGLFFLLMLYNLFREPLKFVRINNISYELSNLSVFISGAILAGIIVTFANWIEDQFTIMFMLYISFYKVLLNHNVKSDKLRIKKI